MAKYTRFVLVVLVAFGLAGALQTSDAQLLKRLKDRAKDKVEKNLGDKQDEAIDKAMDGDSGQSSSAGESNSEASSQSSQSSSNQETMPPAEAVKLKPGEGAWANYDFIPGERPLYVDDFTGDVVGNFPQRLDFKSGNMEIVEWQGARWLRAEGGEFYINLPEELPERFTMEFGLSGRGNPMMIKFSGSDDHDNYIQLNSNMAWLVSGEVNGEGELGTDNYESPAKIRISVDGKYVKLYSNEKRALNVPNANLGRSNRIYVHMNGWSAEDPRLINDIRIMAGGRKLYDALSAEGRVTTQGIFFDTGSDRITPESTPTLKEIGQMLKDHADLRIRVEGHTDNVGGADTNKALSEKRAASVKNFLVETYGIDASRVETAGFGPDQPVAANDTAEGRQMNRRVELVKL